MKLEVKAIEIIPRPDKHSRSVIVIRVQTAEERLAEKAFHKKITSLPPIYVYKTERMGGYEIEITDNFIKNIEKQKKEYEELAKQNPSTRIYKKAG